MWRSFLLIVFLNNRQQEVSALSLPHVIYVTINAASAPSLVIPDIIDNNSLREAQAQLLSMALRSVNQNIIPGEKDWIYGILVNGKHVQAGDRVPSDAVIVLQVGGDGTRQISDTAGLNEPEYEDVEVEEKVPKIRWR